MSILRNRQVELYYEVHGNGEPLLLIAGLASDSQSWAIVLPELAKKFKTIVFDNRGCGRTKCEAEQISIEGMAGDALALLDHLQIEKAHVLGHSMGGYVAQQLCLDYPETVNHLVLAATSAVTNKRNKSLLNNLVAYRESGMDLKEWFRCLFFWIFTRHFFEDSKAVEVNLKLAVEYPWLQSGEGFKMQVKAINEFDNSGSLSKIRHETMIICGKEDILYNPYESIHVLSAIENSSVTIIENAAHAIPVENPVDFTESIVRFLKTE